MKSIFDEATYKEVVERFNKLSADSEGLWGKMSVGQMLWHCQIFFKKSMYNDKPWRKNLPTTPFARAKEEKDFEVEHKKLQELVKELYNLRDRKDWNAHPIFGDFTHEQWGKLEYKHLDHHLRQFGV